MTTGNNLLIPLMTQGPARGHQRRISGGGVNLLKFQGGFLVKLGMIRCLPRRHFKYG